MDSQRIRSQIDENEEENFKDTSSNQFEIKIEKPSIHIEPNEAFKPIYFY